ncbi:MAG: oligosaccharide flippase family protein [Thermoplasmata archaeon]|nr:oligosaccharide flippase family protein [Thermoplasmata archaeon]
MDDPLPTEQSSAGAEAVPRERPLGLSSSFVYAVTFLVQLVGYVSSFFIARHIATSQAGLDLSGFIQFNLLLASSINTLGELRLGSAFVYYIARDASMKKYTGTYFAARAGFVVFFSIALLAASPFIGIVAMSGSLPIPSSTLFLCLGIFMLLPLLWTPSLVYGQLFVGLGDSIRGQMPTLVESAVRTTALVVVALTFPTVGGAVNSHAIWGLTGGYLLGAAAAAAVSMPAVWRHYSAPRWVDLRHLLRYAWPLLGSMGLIYLVTNAMPILTRAFYEVGAVAVFNAANGFRVLLLALPTAIVVPLFPHLAGLHERKELEVLRDRIWRALRYTGMMVVPGAVLFVVYRVNLLLILFQKSYITGVPGAGGGAIPLAILALSAVPLALSQIIGTALNSIGLQRLEFYLTLVQVGVLLAGVFGFRATGGVFGFSGLAAIAFAALLSSIAGLALNSYFLYRNMSIPVRWRPVGTILLAAAAEFLVMSRLNALGSVNAYFAVNRWYQLLGIGALALLVYSVVLILVGELSRQDVRIFAGSIGIGEKWADRLSRICWRETSDPMPTTNALTPPPPQP